MPRHAPTTRFTTMVDRLTAVEATLADLPNLLRNSITAANADFSATITADFDAKLASSFAQLQREQSLVGGAGSSHIPPITVDPIPPPVPVTDDADLRLLETPRHPRRDPFEPGGGPPKFQWQQRVDFPCFSDGDDPITWIYKAEQYFACYNTLDPQKVLTASFYLEHEAMQWFKWRNCLFTTPIWEEFTSALCREFGPSEFEDCTKSLFKLRQTGTLKEYVTKFRRLANRASGVGPALLKSCFLGGLKRELVYDVKLLRPASVHDVISIAVQVDAKLSALRFHNPRTIPATKVTSLPIMPPRPKTTNLPYRKLTLEEVQRKKDQGECWFCPEKWVMGHKCTHKQLLLLDVCDAGELCEENDEVVQAELQGMALSECAFYGMNAKRFLQTMKVLGSVKGQPV
ncbi:hypothetical protein ACFX2A_041739 [Malus domestica]